MNEARVDECNQHLIYRVGASLIWSFGSWSERKVFMERWMESETPSSTFSFSVLRSFCLFSSVSSPALIAVKTDWTESVRLMDDYYYYCRIQSFLFFIVLIGKWFYVIGSRERRLVWVFALLECRWARRRVALSSITVVLSTDGDIKFAFIAFLHRFYGNFAPLFLRFIESWNIFCFGCWQIKRRFLFWIIKRTQTFQRMFFRDLKQYQWC